MGQLHTDQLSVLHLPKDRLTLSSGSSAFIELVFQPQPEGTLVDATVFVNDEEERTEECISIRGCWMPPPPTSVETDSAVAKDVADALDSAKQKAAATEVEAEAAPEAQGSEPEAEPESEPEAEPEPEPEPDAEPEPQAEPDAEPEAEEPQPEAEAEAEAEPEEGAE